MAKYARIDNGTVVEVIDLDVPLTEAFTKDLAALFVAATASVTVGMTWNGSKFGPAPAPQVAPVAVPPSVSSRQFRLQLLAAGLLDQVNAWVKTQSQEVQLSYEYSGTFVRSEQMMTEGFTALNFTDQQIDDFFTAAAKL